LRSGSNSRKSKPSTVTAAVLSLSQCTTGGEENYGGKIVMARKGAFTNLRRGDAGAS